MILFPLALIWVAAVFWWILRKSTNSEDVPGSGGEPRRFRPPPRGPRRPRGDRSGSARNGLTRSR